MADELWNVTMDNLNLNFCHVRTRSNKRKVPVMFPLFYYVPASPCLLHALDANVKLNLAEM